jgi:hypothetical protein
MSKQENKNKKDHPRTEESNYCKFLLARLQNLLSSGSKRVRFSTLD